MNTIIAARVLRTGTRLALMAILGLGSLLRAQNIIENPAKPLAKDAGRALKLTEVWRIADEGGEFYFKSPSDLRIADDGAIFVADAAAEQFLKFSPEGRFLKNLYKKGQGPGEFAGGFLSFRAYPRDEGLYILDFSTQRFWRSDANGVFQGQINLANKNYSDFLGVLPTGFLLVRTASPDVSERTGRLLDVPHTVVLVDKGGREAKEISTFLPKSFYGYQMGMFWDPFVAALSPDGKSLYVCCGRDFIIEALDVATGRIVRRFSRAYPKVPHVEIDWEPDFRKRHGTPKIEYEPDVNNLYPVGDRLWVETSTDDKTKGRLIDVFDKDGRFVDSFHLGAGRALMAVRKDVLYCQEKNEDETVNIVKYRINR